jgi:hypothetical protein
MSIETHRKTSILLIRLAADTFAASDENIVKQTVEQALSAGIRDFLLSVSMHPAFNLAAITRILVWCSDAVRGKNGQLLLFERGGGEGCVFGPLCESLRIPMYRHRFPAPTTALGGASPGPGLTPVRAG